MAETFSSLSHISFPADLLAYMVQNYTYTGAHCSLLNKLTGFEFKVFIVQLTSASLAHYSVFQCSSEGILSKMH